MIDLNKITSKHIIVKVGAQSMKCKKASIELYQRIVSMSDLKDELMLLSEVYAILTDVFNLNIEGVTYLQEDIEKAIDLDTAMSVLMAYIKECTEAMGK